MDSGGARLNHLHFGHHLLTSRHNCSRTVVTSLLYVSNCASRSTSDDQSGDGSAALHLNPFLYESKYVIKNLLTLFVSDLDLFNIFIFNTNMFEIKFYILYIIYYIFENICFTCIILVHTCYIIYFILLIINIIS